MTFFIKTLKTFAYVMEKKKDMKQTRDCQCTIAHSPGARDALHRARVRGMLIIQKMYDFPRSFLRRDFSRIKKLLYQAILFFGREENHTIFV